MVVMDVAYFADDRDVVQTVLTSTMIRNETLNTCYAIPGYADLPREEKLKIYDTVNAQVKAKYGVDY